MSARYPIGLLVLVTLMGSAGCSLSKSDQGTLGSRAATAEAFDPSDADAITARLQQILPSGWRVVRTERDTYPSYRAAGKGIGVFLAPAKLRQNKDEYEVAVYVMPPDYDDGGQDPEGAPTWPAELVAATDRMKVYVWGGWNGARDERTTEQVRKALL